MLLEIELVFEGGGDNDFYSVALSFTLILPKLARVLVVKGSLIYTEACSVTTSLL